MAVYGWETLIATLIVYLINPIIRDFKTTPVSRSSNAFLFTHTHTHAKQKDAVTYYILYTLLCLLLSFHLYAFEIQLTFFHCFTFSYIFLTSTESTKYTENGCVWMKGACILPSYTICSTTLVL